MPDASQIKPANVRYYELPQTAPVAQRKIQLFPNGMIKTADVSEQATFSIPARELPATAKIVEATPVGFSDHGLITIVPVAKAPPIDFSASGLITVVPVAESTPFDFPTRGLLITSQFAETTAFTGGVSASIKLGPYGELLYDIHTLSVSPQEFEQVLAQPNFLGLIDKYNALTAVARRTVKDMSNRQLAGRADILLDAIDAALANRLDKALPLFDAYEADDGSVMIEWVFEHSRLGFSIEIDEKESGWFLIVDGPKNGPNSLGYLDLRGVEKLIKRTINLQR